MKLSELSQLASLRDAHTIPHGRPFAFAGKVYRRGDQGVTLLSAPTNLKKVRRVTKRADYTHKDGRALLRVKIKSLSEEQRIIRMEERRTPSLSRFYELQGHRKVLKQNLRASHIAYGLIRGKTIDQVEAVGGKTDLYHTQHVVKQALALAGKYGPPTGPKYWEANPSCAEDMIAWMVHGKKIQRETPRVPLKRLHSEA